MTDYKYPKLVFTDDQVLRFERYIDRYIAKGHTQIRLSTGIVSKETQEFANYLSFYYPSGTFSPNPYFKNYAIAKKGKKYAKKENW